MNKFVWNGKSGWILAETGSGKTLAYLIPTLNKLFYTIERNKQKSGGSEQNDEQSNL